VSWNATSSACELLKSLQQLLLHYIYILFFLTVK
jgi:hypothetical protein